ncbi:MAG: iron chelate uptake ABC transporter family permease subunit [Demequina sp.]
MRVVTIGPMGFLTHTRVLVVGWALVAAIVALGAVTVSVGPVAVSVADSLLAALGIPVGPPGDFIVGQLRAPRMYTTLLMGAMFGLSGTILQSLTRNPLASPDFIGISAGAGMGAVITIATVGTTSVWITAGGAAAGALLAAAIMVALSWRRGIVPLRLILTGIGIGFVASAVSQYILTILDISIAQNALIWLVGSTNASTWQQVLVCAVVLAVLLPPIMWLSRPLRTLEMGDETAAALGVAVTRSRLLLAVASVLLAAGATAVVGPVGFIALVAPALARHLTRAPGVTLLPSALMGAALALAADLAAQHATGELQLPIGIYTAAVGAPYLLYLVWRSARGGTA